MCYAANVLHSGCIRFHYLLQFLETPSILVWKVERSTKRQSSVVPAEDEGYGGGLKPLRVRFYLPGKVCVRAMITDKERGQSTKSFGDEKVLSLKDVIRVLRTYVWLIGIVTLLGLGTSLVLSFIQEPEYEASIKILVGQESGFVGETGNVSQLTDLTTTMAQTVRTRPVAEEVIRRQGLNLTPDALLGRLNAGQIPNTQLITVSYRDSDPTRARLLANAIGEVFSEQVTEVSPDVSAVTATVWEKAAVPGQPINPNYPRNMVVGVAIGAMLGLGLAFLLDYLDNSKPSPRVNRARFREAP
jgi:capsular polysaccharide biosynthesis protein